MPFLFRKSVRAGPFRFNFSKAGLNASVGVKGLRLGTGPRGHYICAGRGAIRYRGSLRQAGGNKAPSVITPSAPRLSSAIDFPVEMIEVDSGSVLEMRDEAFGAVLDDINAASRKSRLAIILPTIVVIIALLAAYLGDAENLALLVLTLPASGLGLWIDSYRRATVLHYDLIDGAEDSFRRITEAFDALMRCSGKWHIEAGGAIRDLATWKRNAGASHLVRRSATTLAYKLPTVVKSNITPPALHIGRQIIFFSRTWRSFKTATDLALLAMQTFGWHGSIQTSLKQSAFLEMLKSSATLGSIRTRAAAPIDGSSSIANCRFAFTTPCI